MKTLRHFFSRKPNPNTQGMSEASGNVTAVWPNPAVGHLPKLSNFANQQLALCRELIKPSTKPDAVDLESFMAISESFPAKVCTSSKVSNDISYLFL